MNALTRRRGMMPRKQSVLPSEFQEVEYIEGDGASWLVTNFVLPLSFRFELGSSVTTQVNREKIIFSCIENNGGRFGIEVFYNNTTSGVRFFAGASSEIIIPSIYTLVELSGSSNGSTITFSGTQNGVTYTGVNRGVSRQYTAKPVCLFGSAGGGALLTGKIYYVRFYDSTDAIIANFVPCYRKSDGKIGMHDTVSQSFFTNAGTGTFTKGADVN